MELSNLIAGTEERIQIKDKRFYVFPSGDLVPSVTTIIDSGWPKGEALGNWKGTVGLEAAEKIKNEAADKGTNVHNAVELLLQGKVLRFDDFTLDEWKCIIAAHRFIEDWKITPILIEQVVIGESESGLSYAGSCDLICHATDPKTQETFVTYLDWKSSKSLHATYDMQLVAYGNAGQSCLKIAPELYLVIHLGNQTKKGYTAHVVKDVDKLTTQFDLACQIWYLKNPDIKLRYQEVPSKLQIDRLKHKKKKHD